MFCLSSSAKTKGKKGGGKDKPKNMKSNTVGEQEVCKVICLIPFPYSSDQCIVLDNTLF